MGNKIMTFEEAKIRIIDKIKDRISECENDLKDIFRVSLSLSGNEFRFSLEIQDTEPKIDLLRRLSNAIYKLEKLDIYEYKIKHIGKIVSAPKLATVQDWQNKIFCTDIQIGKIALAIINNQKSEFNRLMSEITDNKTMSNNYTKEIFGSGVGHR